MKGCYILLIALNDNAEIEVGKLGLIKFKKGTYAYVGSAMGGLEQRISRHLRQEKNIRWHIDYLLEGGNVSSVHIKPSDVREECAFSQKLSQNHDVVERFGSSDCKCRGHLYVISDVKVIERELQEYGFKSYKSSSDD